MNKEKITRYTKIVKHLNIKGFSPSQIRHICIVILKLEPRLIRRKVSMYVSRDWIRNARARFFRENIVKELRELGLYGKR